MQQVCTVQVCFGLIFISKINVGQKKRFFTCETVCSWPERVRKHEKLESKAQILTLKSVLQEASFEPSG